MTVITSLPEAQAYVAGLLLDPQIRIVAMTGAGISTDSGIPDYRSPGGAWTKRQPVQYQYFVSSHESRMKDWDQRFEMQEVFGRAHPNAAHLALAALARRGNLTMLITQNVDGLHQRSGVPQEKLVELHGNATFATCLSCGARAELEDQRASVEADESPACQKCGGYLKAAVINFGQQMPELELERAAAACEDCDLFLVLGSSLVVHPAAQLPVHAVRNRADLVILNREPTDVDALAKTVIRTPLAKTFENFPMN
ncbi:NAD-dependent deacetylase [Roseibium denhamense]|uniref:protein acetyllysine N-acetyltransferase n=1 Tax=Roseibium denhamense TaxID=76305 RepID=A0ABY1NR86_9HYPH|nr:Sir2 family NAD-dependent protein deacetylase [Roseibium denhamense]MTI08014.1 NAD-dependent deacetylase [Roseibium denhamense]SMP15586.1 NAD-dependent deacetylase [Roseibium denhamense]